MNLILSKSPLDPNWVAKLASQIGAQTTHVAEHRAKLAGWTDTTELRARVTEACADAQVDHAYMPAGVALNDYRLLVMDMDSTLITIECVDEIADLAGKKAEVAAITEAAMRGEITNYSESLHRRVGHLRGLDEDALRRIYDERLELSPGAEKMLAAMRAAGLKTLLVSGGFRYFTDRLQQRLSLDYTRSNELTIVDGKLTGEVPGTIVDAEEKARTVRDLCAKLGIATSQAIVIGDGANDLRMMALAGISVAFHAKPVVQAQTTHAIRFGGLDVLLDWFAD